MQQNDVVLAFTVSHICVHVNGSQYNEKCITQSNEKHNTIFYFIKCIYKTRMKLPTD